jgi:enoyl-CoA hydratase
MDSEYALKIRLVQEISEQEDLLGRAMEVAESIAEKSPIAIQKTKFMVRAAHNMPLDFALLVENDSFSYLMMTEDAKEGQRAFADKRKPIFKGR